MLEGPAEARKIKSEQRVRTDTHTGLLRQRQRGLWCRGRIPACPCLDSLRASYFTVVPPFPHLSDRADSIKLTGLFRRS